MSDIKVPVENKMSSMGIALDHYSLNLPFQQCHFDHVPKTPEPCVVEFNLSTFVSRIVISQIIKRDDIIFPFDS